MLWHDMLCGNQPNILVCDVGLLSDLVANIVALATAFRTEHQLRARRSGHECNDLLIHLLTLVIGIGVGVVALPHQPSHNLTYHV